MAGRDNVLFGTTIASGTASGTVVPIPLMYGVENVRQGYGTPRLKSVKAYYGGGYTSNPGVPVSIKNSNWIDDAGLVAQRFQTDIALSKGSLAFMRGRDKVLQPNTSWIINVTLPAQTTSAMYMFVLVEIEYSDVAGINPENASGSPVMKSCRNASVTAASTTPVSIGSFDNLLQGVTYVLSEISAEGLNGDGGFVIIEGFSNQKGLIRIIPAKSSGMAEQIEGSVYLNKQTYNVSVLNVGALSASAVTVRMELVASQN